MKHQFDRHHFYDQITKHWHAVKDKEKYKKTIVKILDTANKDELDLLLQSAFIDYEHDHTAIKLIQKISDKRSSLCFAHTSDRFNHGHVSSGRVEKKNSSIKGNGKLKEVLSKSTLFGSLT